MTFTSMLLTIFLCYEHLTSKILIIIMYLDGGYTRSHCFELSGNSVTMKQYFDSKMVIVHKYFEMDQLNTVKQDILHALFGDTIPEYYFNGKIILQHTQIKNLSDDRLKSLGQKYASIPMEYLPYYPPIASKLTMTTEAYTNKRANDVISSIVIKDNSKKAKKLKVLEKSDSQSSQTTMTHYFAKVEKRMEQTSKKQTISTGSDSKNLKTNNDYIRSSSFKDNISAWLNNNVSSSALVESIATITDNERNTDGAINNDNNYMKCLSNKHIDNTNKITIDIDTDITNIDNKHNAAKSDLASFSINYVPPPIGLVWTRNSCALDTVVTCLYQIYSNILNVKEREAMSTSLPTTINDEFKQIYESQMRKGNATLNKAKSNLNKYFHEVKRLPFGKFISATSVYEALFENSSINDKFIHTIRKTNETEGRKTKGSRFVLYMNASTGKTNAGNISQLMDEYMKNKSFELIKKEDVTVSWPTLLYLSCDGYVTDSYCKNKLKYDMIQPTLEIPGHDVLYRVVAVGYGNNTHFNAQFLHGDDTGSYFSYDGFNVPPIPIIKTLSARDIKFPYVLKDNYCAAFIILKKQTKSTSTSHNRSKKFTNICNSNNNNNNNS